MSPAYISAVANNLPGADIVFDRFHVVKLFNEKLSDFRRSLFNHLAGKPEEQELIKGTRWLLLKNPENLQKGRDEDKRLNCLWRCPISCAVLKNVCLLCCNVVS